MAAVMVDHYKFVRAKMIDELLLETSLLDAQLLSVNQGDTRLACVADVLLSSVVLGFPSGNTFESSGLVCSWPSSCEALMDADLDCFEDLAVCENTSNIKSAIAGPQRAKRYQLMKGSVNIRM